MGKIHCRTPYTVHVSTALKYRYSLYLFQVSVRSLYRYAILFEKNSKAQFQDICGKMMAQKPAIFFVCFCLSIPVSYLLNDIYSLRSKRSGIVEIKSQKHGCSIGSSTPNPPIKAPEARSPFPDFFYRGLYWYFGIHCTVLE